MLEAHPVAALYIMLHECPNLHSLHRPNAEFKWSGISKGFFELVIFLYNNSKNSDANLNINFNINYTHPDLTSRFKIQILMLNIYLFYFFLTNENLFPWVNLGCSQSGLTAVNLLLR